MNNKSQKNTYCFWYSEHAWPEINNETGDYILESFGAFWHKFDNAYILGLENEVYRMPNGEHTEVMSIDIRGIPKG